MGFKVETFENGDNWKQCLRCRVVGRKRKPLKTVFDPLCKVEHFKVVDKRFIILVVMLQLISNLATCLQLNLALSNLQEQYARRQTLNMTKVLDKTRVLATAKNSALNALFPIMHLKVAISQFGSDKNN